MNDIIHKFDQTTKLTIRSADEPVYITIGNIRENNPKFNIKRGALKLSGYLSVDSELDYQRD